jgi:hypothetical protein
MMEIILWLSYWTGSFPAMRFLTEEEEEKGEILQHTVWPWGR